MGAKPHPPLPAPQPVAVLGRRPQIARSMRLRLALLMVTLLVSPALTGGAKLAAQEPSPYLPLADWATPYLEHLIARDRKSTRLNSSHTVISYAVFCLKKKKTLRRRPWTL